MARPVRMQHHLLFVAFAAVVCSQLVLNVAAAKERWESGKNSFEDPEYDPEATSSEDQSEEPPEQLVVCEADKNPRISCTCDKTSPVTLKCGGAKLETARLYVAEDFGVALQVAHLERNEITSLSKNRILPGQEKSLQTLDLAHNKIDAIQPGAFDPFASLLELKLSHNRLDELSDDIFTPQMGSLRQLYLDHNFISKLDDGVFDNLNSLTKLVLDGNARIKLSNKVFTSALAKLEVLSLDHCHLDDTLDAELFVNLLNLRALSLSGNNLNSVPLAVGPAKLPALQVLAMSDTYLHSMDNTALAERVPKLQKLYMRRMKYLEKIDDCAFCKLPSLEVLDFSDSPKLAQIDANAFGTTLPASLRQLNFKNCNISTLVEGLLPNSYFGTLKALRLGGNPWNCGCQLKWLLDNDRAIRLASEFEEPTCTAPESLKGISFYKAHDHLEKTCGPPSDGASPMGMFVVLLVSMVLAASLLVFGVFYARRRFQLAGFGEGGSGNFRVPEFLGGGSFQRASFSAGRNIFDDELEDVGDQHEEETGHHDAAVAAGQRPRAEFV